MIDVRVQTEPFDTAAVLSAFELEGVGAVASFTGLVRGDDGVTAIELEHYPAMTEARSACTHWPRKRIAAGSFRVAHSSTAWGEWRWANPSSLLQPPHRTALPRWRRAPS
jgi:molybdopterin synthase catalytic subunit